ncbi:MAG: aminotransferase class V-fold PLP-dependent enzyme, partial [Firmicutes bacterium]|nr:aminotransferase class V-fold PLP-dependent enzyme [Bacillota bacterium]
KALADYQSAKTWGQYKEMREAFLRAFEGMEGVQVGGGVVGNSVSQSECAPHIISISIPGIKAEVLQSVLSDRVIVGIGSACNTKRSENRVLSATGLKKEQVEGTIRISFGSHNTMGEVQTAAQVIVQEIQKLRKIGA